MRNSESRAASSGTRKKTVSLSRGCELHWLFGVHGDRRQHSSSEFCCSVNSSDGGISAVPRDLASGTSHNVTAPALSGSPEYKSSERVCQAASLDSGKTSMIVAT